jgi:hypothetical protein
MFTVMPFEDFYRHTFVLELRFRRPTIRIPICYKLHKKMLGLRFIRPFQGVVRRNASGKVVKFGVEGRALMLEGVNLLADAVQVCWTDTFT